MKSPPNDDIATDGATAGRLDEVSVAARTGRLVSLLKGEGLNKGAIEELLRPESVSVLKAILTHHLWAKADHGTRRDRHNPDMDNQGNGPAECSGDDGDAPPKRKDGRAPGLRLLFGTEER